MRFDYTLYVLAALLLIITVIPFVVTIEGVESDTRSLWVVTTVVLGLLSIGLGYTQRPKTEAQACQPAVSTQAQPAEMEAPKQEKTLTPTEPAMVENAASTMALTQVKGIGEKRAVQLKTLGINSVKDLSKASAATVAKQLKVSPKIVDTWIANAKKLVK